MRFSSAGRAEQDQVCAIFEPAVSGTDRHHLRLRYHRNRVAVERIERFSRQQFRLRRSEEHTSELQSLMRISYAVFCLKNKTQTIQMNNTKQITNTTQTSTTNKQNH